MLRDPVAYAHAIASAFAADLAESPTLTDVIAERRVTQDGFRSIILKDLQRSITGESGPNLFPHMRAFVKSLIDANVAAKNAGVSGLGAAAPEGAFGMSASMTGGITSLVGAVTGVVSAVWGAKIQAGAIKNLGKVQLQEAQLAERSQEIALQRAQIENATAVGIPGGAPGTGPSGGVIALGPVAIPAAVEIGGTSVPTATLALAALAVMGGGWYAFHGR